MAYVKKVGYVRKRVEFDELFFSLLGTMSDYRLAEKYNVDRTTVKSHRNKRNIPSYASMRVEKSID